MDETICQCGINGQTQVFGILGNPVRHTKSPAMQNAAFCASGMNAVYLPFPVENIEHALLGVRNLGISGLSVTIPFKQSVMSLLDEIDPVAEKIGAVNTIHVSEKDGQRILKGYNTDWLGALGALQREISLKGTRAVVLGAGGSARAIGFGLKEHQVDFKLCSRTERSGKELAHELGCEWLPVTQIETMEGDILINATSVGMNPNSNVSLVSADVLQRFSVVMDIVYSPLKTLLLSDAEKAGCKIVNGLEMLLYQGVAQFEIWTETTAPIEVMRQTLFAAMA